MNLKQFIIILPELMLVLLALLTQLVTILFNTKIKIITTSIIILSTILIFVILQVSRQEAIGFNSSFAINYVTGIYKALILTFSIMTIIIYCDYCKISSEEFKYEFITLVLLSTVGIFIAISARNFLLLFCGMELQALIAYVLAGFDLTNIKSSESALKYLILGAVVSCLTLFGISFIYGFSGSLEFSIILHILNQSSHFNIGLVIGLVFFLSGIFFKLSAAPLHIGIPDIYEGSPISTVMYFATSQKIGIVVVLLNIITLVIWDYQQISIDLIKFIAILSMLIGTGGAIRQTSLKRLMAYSTILNVGYILIGISLHSEQGSFAAMLYMVTYVVGVMGFFVCLIILLDKRANNATFDDLRGIASNHQVVVGAITIIMFSIIGIPPLAGFFGKYYLFYQAIMEQEFLLAFIGLATSIVAAYYYLKVIKSMYFLPNTTLLIQEQETRKPIYKGVLLVNYLVMGFILFCLSPLQYFLSGKY